MSVDARPWLTSTVHPGARPDAGDVIASGQLCVDVYDSDRLVARIACDTAVEAAALAGRWDGRDGFSCTIAPLPPSRRSRSRH